MGEVVEVLFVGIGEENQLSCTAWDYRTGTNLMTYRGGGCVQSRTLCILGADYVISANSTKPILHVWAINAQEQMSSVRFVVPGRVGALALSPDNCFVLAAVQESIYIWHLATGRMLKTIGKHYQAISCIRLTDDGSHFITAGKDGTVLIWNLTRVVEQNIGTDTPVYSLKDHGLPVTDVHVGAGAMRCYMYTVSLDRSCKVYDLSSGKLLLNVVFAEGLHSVIANAIETSVYVGTSEGNIYEFNLDALPRIKEYHMEMKKTNKFPGHLNGQAVTCLTLSADGQTLVSGGNDQQVCVWHIPTRQMIKVIPQKGIVTNLRLRLTNPVIFYPEYKQPQIFTSSLHRMIDPVEIEEEQAIEVLVAEVEPDFVRIRTRRNLQSPGTKMSNVCRSTGENSAIYEEFEKSRGEIQKLKRVNKELFEVSAKLLLKPNNK